MTQNVDKGRVASATTDPIELPDVPTPAHVRDTINAALAEGGRRGLSAQEKMDLLYERLGLVAWLRESVRLARDE